MDTPTARRRLSRLAVLAGVLSGVALLGFAFVFGLGTLAIGGVPVLGILALLVWVPAAAFVFLVLCVLALGFGAAAAARIRERDDLHGIPWTVFGRVAGGVGVGAALVILVGTVAIPAFLAQQESAAWRRTADRGITSFQETSAKLTEIDASLQKGIVTLGALTPNASPLDRAKLAALFSDQAARLQEITEALALQSKSWQTALETTLKDKGANAATAAKWLGAWWETVMGKAGVEGKK